MRENIKNSHSGARDFTQNILLYASKLRYTFCHRAIFWTIPERPEHLDRITRNFLTQKNARVTASGCESILLATRPHPSVQRSMKIRENRGL